MAEPGRARAYLLRDAEPTRLGLAGRRLSPFAGRETELGLLRERLGQVRATSHGQVVGITGEPGAGKSRLLLEFRERLADAGVAYLEGRCASRGTGTPYLPLVDLLRRAWSLDDQPTHDAAAERVRGALAALGLDADAIAPYVLRLLGARVGDLEGLSPEAIRARTFDALERVLRAAASDGPLVLLIEDLHWIDPTSEAFLTAFVERLPGSPVLVVVTARPGYQMPWLARSFATQLALPPLDGGEGAAIVRTVLANEVGDSPVLVEQIVARGEGNPFFLEELAWSVAGRSPGDDAPPVPVTVAAALDARIDRLADEPRRVLEAAAVIGREVPLALLAAVTATPAHALVVPLRQLLAAEFLYEHPGSMFVFKHALTQEAAYGRLSDAERRGLHRTAGQALEALYADRIEEMVDRLAYHYSRTDEHAKATQHLVRFGEQATARYSLHEAVGALKEALAHAEQYVTTAARHAACNP